MQAVEEYLEISKPTLFAPSQSTDQQALARKSSAQRLARSATEAISDRRIRAEAKVAVYNHLIPILERHHDTQQALHRTYRRLLACSWASLLLVAGLATIL